jgi:hypothetical protein
VPPPEDAGRARSRVTIAVIITVTRVDKRKMILWRSLRVEVNATPTVRAAPAATMINTANARALDDQQVGAALDVAASYDHLPDSGWAVLPTRPVAVGRQVSTAY